MSDDVIFQCVHCSKNLRIAVSMLGRQCRCSECNTLQVANLVADPPSLSSVRDRKRVTEQLGAAKRDKQRAEADLREAANLRTREEIQYRREQQMQTELRARQQESQHHRVLCPYCRGQIPNSAQKCMHCGEFLAGTEHSDVLACLLGLFLGPVGLWYKGHFAAGFAWLAFWIIVVLATGGVGICLAPFFWLGMGIHAATVHGSCS